MNQSRYRKRSASWAEAGVKAEAAAVGAYSRLLRDPRSPAVTEALRRHLEDHRQALGLLGSLSPSGGAVPPPPEELPSSSPWAAALASGRDVHALLAELERAESESLSAYEAAAKDQALSPADRVALRTVILPRQRSHAAHLGRLRSPDAETSVD